jgi:hypothetical protein
VERLWNLFAHGMMHKDSKEVQNQWWILWRRVAGGLGASEQERLFAKVYPMVRTHEASQEILMLLGSLERVDPKKKAALGELLVSQLEEGRWNLASQKIWALTRIAGRVPLYGGGECILPANIVRDWTQRIRELKTFKGTNLDGLKPFYLSAGRLIGSRELDLDEAARMEIAACLGRLGVSSEEAHRVLFSVNPMDAATANYLQGDALPSGLLLRP